MLQSFVQKEEDLVFRIGGEEFAGLINRSSIEEGEALISQLNTEIENLNIEHLQSKLSTKKLTVSIGVCSELVTAKTDMEHFYKLADLALYEAKETGRNKMLVHK